MTQMREQMCWAQEEWVIWVCLQQLLLSVKTFETMLVVL
jgi:hypothetical protein